MADPSFTSILLGRCGTVKLSHGLILKHQEGIPGVKSDQNHVGKRILGGKSLQYEGSCPASVGTILNSILDTSCGFQNTHENNGFQN